jgi:hypothetical protein
MGVKAVIADLIRNPGGHGCRIKSGMTAAYQVRHDSPHIKSGMTGHSMTANQELA